MKSEEVKIYASVKFPIDGVQYAMGEVGGSWSVGIENGEVKSGDIQDMKSKALQSLLQDMETQLKERSKSVIDGLVKKEVVEIEKEYKKKIELARTKYLKLKNSKNEV